MPQVCVRTWRAKGYYSWRNDSFHRVVGRSTDHGAMYDKNRKKSLAPSRRALFSPWRNAEAVFVRTMTEENPPSLYRTLDFTHSPFPSPTQHGSQPDKVSPLWKGRVLALQSAEDERRRHDRKSSTKPTTHPCRKEECGPGHSGVNLGCLFHGNSCKSRPVYANSTTHTTTGKDTPQNGS